MAEKLPSLVIVGRPNVGKSTLFNRLTGTRRAIVTDEPGITRDRMYGKTEWNGRVLEVVDTGGIVPDDKALIPTEIFRQARVAFENAALLVLVVDSQAGLTPLDQELARLLRSTGKPFVVAVNKIDSAMQEANAATFYSLGVPVFPIAAEHGTGVDDLLDEALKQALGHAVEDQPAEKKEVEIAIIGRPNVGKSTLLNRLAGEERSIVSPIPGTTMDNVDTDVMRDGRVYRFVDTAGIRRKGKTKLVAEKLSVVMARRGLERADVALLIIDGEHGVTSGDATIASYAEESGRSVIIVVNKWDLAVEAAQRAEDVSEKSARGKAKRAAAGGVKQRPVDKHKLLFDYEKMVQQKFKFLSYAPIIFLSAKTGERTEKGEAVFPDRSRRRGPEAEGFNGRAEPLVEGRRGFAARFNAQGSAGPDLLYDPGQDLPTGVFIVHQPEEAAAFQLRAFPGKPVARKMGFYGHPGALCAAPAQTRRSLPGRWRRGVSTSAVPFGNIASRSSSTVAACNTF